MLWSLKLGVSTGAVAGTVAFFAALGRLAAARAATVQFLVPAVAVVDAVLGGVSSAVTLIGMAFAGVALATLP